MNPTETASQIIQSITQVLNKNITAYRNSDATNNGLSVSFGRSVEILSIQHINTILTHSPAQEYYGKVKYEIVNHFKKNK